MKHSIHKVVRFVLLSDYKIFLKFEDGVEREIDFTPVLHGELFGALRDMEVFRSVKLDPETHTLVWPNGADFDPETLHDWDKCVGDIVSRLAA